MNEIQPRCPARQDTFLISETSTLVLSSTHSAIEWVPVFVPQE